MTTAYDIIEAILVREGGYVNDPNDLGGATNFGITIKTLSDYRKRQVDIEEVRNLTKDQAREIYKQNYLTPFVDAAGGNVQLLALLVDSAVQHGVGRVQSWLLAVKTSDPAVIYRTILKRRIQFYGEIITARPENAKFAKGWMNRVSEFVL